MKVGDKVILRKYESCDSLDWWGGDYWIGKETIVEKIDDTDGTFMFADSRWWLQLACEPCSEPVKNERYFFFSYVSGNSTGNIWMKNREGKIPSNVFVVEHLKKEYLLNKVVITNIFEFKSEQDFLDFTSNE